MEPVVATAIGVFVFGELLTGFQIFGIILIIAAVIILQWSKKENKKTPRIV
jgi:drug/metabolite transporter (DMT)-like permease